MRNANVRAGAMALAAVVLAAGGELRAEPAGTIVLQPHRAVYDLELSRTSAGGGMTSITGRVVYELMGNTCEGYAQNMRFVTQTANGEGQADTTDLRTSSWENVPAQRLRFNSSTYGNDQLSDQTQGVATKGAAGGKVTVDLAKPRKKAAKLDGPLYFPIEHSMEIIRHARSGQKFFAALLYDGSEGGEKIYETTAAIGRKSTVESHRQLAELKNGARLADVPSWPVSISYFTPGPTRKADAVPLYEMSFRFHDNGITSELVIDHGEYALKGVLKELQWLDANPCPVRRN